MLSLTLWIHLGCGMPRVVLGHALGPEISGLIEPFGSSHKRRRVSAKLTTEHSASSHGQPVIVLPDGSALDPCRGWAVGIAWSEPRPRNDSSLPRWGSLNPRYPSPDLG